MPVVDTPKGPVEFPDDMSRDQIEAALAKEFGGTDERTWVDTAVDALPLVGGVAGGMAGAALGPLAIGTAAIGGAGGEGFRRAIQTLRGKRPVDASTADTVEGIAKAGRDQGTAQAVGMGVGKALQAGGRGAMRMAFGAQKPLRGKFPTVDLEGVALREGIGPGQARAAKAASSAANKALVDATKAADAAGAGRTRFADIRPRLAKLHERYTDARMPEAAAAVADEGNKLFRTMRGGLSQAESLVAKQERQALARAALQGASDPRTAGVSKKINAEVSRGIADAMRRVPATAKAMDRSQELMMLDKAVGNAATSTPMLRWLLPVAGAGTGYASGGDVGSSVKGALGAYALTNPRVLSLLGRGMHSSAPAGREVGRLLALLLQDRGEQ